MRRRSSRARRAGGAGITAGGVIAALGIAVTACSATARPLPVMTDSGPPTTLPRATCGAVSTHGLSGVTQLLSGSKGTLTCFDTAARQCKSAAIEVTVMGVDTGTSHVFAIASGGKPCQVTEVSQSYSAIGGRRTGKVDATPCHLGSVTSAGVTLSCAGQEVLIPAKIA